MSELTIAASGEVKLEYEVIGQIAWTSPTALFAVAGAWISADHIWDIEDEIDSLRRQLTEVEDDYERALMARKRLAAQLAEVRLVLEGAP